MNTGVSPLRHRARMLGAKAVRRPINGGGSPHHRIAREFWREGRIKRALVGFPTSRPEIPMPG